jgi:1,4-dihydroxy-2-naphthoate polyprenyltransferase
MSGRPPPSGLARAIAFVRLGRPHFLVGGLVLYGLGAAVAVYAGAAFVARAYLLGQAAITAFQLMTHYANDYFDLAADRANRTPTRFSGGSRVLADGTLPPWVALATALALAALGVALVAALALRGGAGGGQAAAVALLADALAWAYSAPPLALHSRGLGELTTALVVAVLTPAVGFLVQAGGGAAMAAALPAPIAPTGLAAGPVTPGGLPVPPLLLLGAAVLPLCGLQFAMLLAIELPDAEGDAATGKRTLVVRLGGALAVGLYRAVLVAVYGSLPVLLALGLPPLAALAAGAAAPVALWQFYRLGKGDWRDPGRWERLTFVAVAMLVASAFLELAAFVHLIRTAPFD